MPRSGSCTPRGLESCTGCCAPGSLRLAARRVGVQTGRTRWRRRCSRSSRGTSSSRPRCLRPCRSVALQRRRSAWRRASSPPRPGGRRDGSHALARARDRRPRAGDPASLALPRGQLARRGGAAEPARDRRDVDRRTYPRARARPAALRRRGVLHRPLQRGAHAAPALAPLPCDPGAHARREAARAPHAARQTLAALDGPAPTTARRRAVSARAREPADLAETRVRAAWDEARTGLGLGRDDAALEHLIARYREPHRRYHDLRHIAACLEELDRVRALAARPAEVAMALLFHDAIYAPLARDNEARSAALAGECLERAGANPAATARIRAAIEATRSHEAPDGGDAALVLDVYMSILAAPAATFDAYEDGVRGEHAMIDDASFARGRSAFVRGLLERERLFHVAALHERWNAAARANLERSARRWRRA